MKATTGQAYQLFHQGTQALAEVERAGMRIDVARLDSTVKEVGNQIEELISGMTQSGVWKLWKKRWGVKANLGSRYQLGPVLFEDMDYTSTSKTKTGRTQVNEESLEQVDNPFVKDYLRLEKLKKLQSTYLKGIRRETVNGFLHPSFNLHLVKSFRSSADSPNFQNIPIRDPEVGKLIRSCFIPREDHVLVEVDYSALEFRVAAMHWRDEAMIAYASDSTLDVHRDMAAECYCLPVDRVPKKCRFFAKNQFVFPQLYGSFYANCARSLWGMISSAELTTDDGVGLFEHLADRGIDRLGSCDGSRRPEKGTFEKHIMEVETRFRDKFPQWAKRKEQWWKKYRKCGWFDMMTGFRCQGVYSRNQLYNIPIQGPAFHLLLWSLIQVVRTLKRDKMRSRVVGQIHDSIVADVHRDELNEYLSLVKRVMTVDVREHWPWVVVPLEIEVEKSETNWFEKVAVEA